MDEKNEREREHERARGSGQRSVRQQLKGCEARDIGTGPMSAVPPYAQRRRCQEWDLLLPDICGLRPVVWMGPVILGHNLRCGYHVRIPPSNQGCETGSNTNHYCY